MKHSSILIRSLCLLIATLQPVLSAASGPTTSFSLTQKGKASCVIVQDASATEPEQAATKELISTLRAITGGHFEVVTNVGEEAAIVVGPGAAATKLFPNINFSELGPEELLVQSTGNKLLLAGGRPRGTLYAVNRFLEKDCGVRWWAPWATDIPRQPTLKVRVTPAQENPAFEYRAPFWYSAFEPEWKVHNAVNSPFHDIPSALGGCLQYKGHAHTFYPLVPPDKYFKEHPEWYSLINSKRTHERAQLCLTNPQLREFVVTRVKEWLRESPDAQIISVTQNDWAGWCECAQCKALDDAEQSHAGTMLDFVNYIAEKIEPEFPKVWVDTFAYQYTRKPPKTIRPRKNVIVRLCSIECNFREPLDHPSNTSFLADIKGWSRICSHLYIWDYTTDFKNYIHPHPNWFTLGPNVRVFAEYGVKGLFEQGAYAGYGAEMSELRSWVLAKLLWDPSLDDQALTREFLRGYYGAAAEKPLFRYLQLLHENSKGVYLRCYLSKEVVPYLSFPVMGEAERLWQQAEKAMSGDAEKLARIRQGHLALRCAYLRYWNRLSHECWEQNDTWPLSKSRKAVAEEFRQVASGIEGKPWTKVHVMNEPGLTVDTFLKDFGEDLPELAPAPPKRSKHPFPPRDLPALSRMDCIDLQDNRAALYQPWKSTSIAVDEAASDLRAVKMPGTHKEWAFRIAGAKLPKEALSGKWNVYVVARARLADDSKDGPVFAAGVYDNNKKSSAAELIVKSKELSEGYKSFSLGEVELNPDRDIWVAPPGRKEVEEVWIDRVYLTRVRR